MLEWGLAGRRESGIIISNIRIGPTFIAGVKELDKKGIIRVTLRHYKEAIR